MIVVGDTGPLNYLLLIGHVDVLSSLFSHVVIPRAVAAEPASARAPEVVRRWVGNPPTWLDVQPDPEDDGALSNVDSGERSAIALAVLIKVPHILMDDMDGRMEAERRKLKVTRLFVRQDTHESPARLPQPRGFHVIGFLATF